MSLELKMLELLHDTYTEESHPDIIDKICGVRLSFRSREAKLYRKYNIKNCTILYIFQDKQENDYLNEIRLL